MYAFKNFLKIKQIFGDFSRRNLEMIKPVHKNE